MNLFFDTEFTGLHKGTQLISLGIVAEDGQEFYCEFADLNPSEYDSWLIDNVFKNTILYGDIKTEMICDSSDYYIGTRETLRLHLIKWLSQFDNVQFISDVCHYDMVLLIDLLGDNAFDVPQNVVPCCYDINQDIAKHFEVSLGKAFDMSREHILQELGLEQISGFKHNSLYDAKVIKELYQNL